MLPGQRGRKQSCPLCGTLVSLPAAPQTTSALTPWLSTSSSTAIQAASTPEAADEEVEEEGSSPYAVAKTEEVACPSCRKILAPGTSVCTGCGHDLEVKRDRTLPVVVRHWQVGLPPPWRVGIFLLGQVLAVLALVMAAYHDELSTAVFSWFLFTGMLAFLLGTYDWVDLTRNHRGRVVLSKTWRFCFVPRPPVVFRLSEYEGVTSGRDRGADLWDWLAFFTLLGMGLVPGLIWFYFCIYRDRFFVALTQCHGSPEEYLYRGLNEEHMHEMTRTIDGVAFPS